MRTRLRRSCSQSSLFDSVIVSFVAEWKLRRAETHAAEEESSEANLSSQCVQECVLLSSRAFPPTL